MEEFPPPWPQPWHNVLEVGSCRCGAADHRGLEPAATDAEEHERCHAAADLETKIGDVLVRDSIRRDMHDRPEQQRERPGAREGTGSRTRRDVERNDHAPIIAYDHAS